MRRVRRTPGRGSVRRTVVSIWSGMTQGELAEARAARPSAFDASLAAQLDAAEALAREVLAYAGLDVPPEAEGGNYTVEQWQTKSEIKAAAEILNDKGDALLSLKLLDGIRSVRQFLSSGVDAEAVALIALHVGADYVTLKVNFASRVSSMTLRQQAAPKRKLVESAIARRERMQPGSAFQRSAAAEIAEETGVGAQQVRRIRRNWKRTPRR